MRGVIFAMVATFAAACDEPVAKGWAAGSLLVPVCDDGERLDRTCAEGIADLTAPQCVDEPGTPECDAFDLGADFFSLEIFGDESAKLRIQLGGQDFALTDGLVFEIQDIRRLRGELGTTLAVGPEENIRAALALFATCPETNENFELRGGVTFLSFGKQPGDRIAGCVDGLEIRDGRGEAPGEVLGYLQAHFDFSYSRGTPYQRFSR